MFQLNLGAILHVMVLARASYSIREFAWDGGVSESADQNERVDAAYTVGQNTPVESSREK